MSFLTTHLALHAPSGALVRGLVLVVFAAVVAIAPLAAGAEPAAADGAAAGALGEQLCGWY